MAADVPTVSRVTPRRIRYAVFAMVMLLLALYAQMLPVLRDRLMGYLGVGTERFGLMFSLGTLAGGVSVLISGVLIDRFGPRVVMRTAFIGMAAAFLVIAAAGDSFVVFACGVALAGFCVRPVHLGASAYLVQLFPRHRRRLLSLNLVSQGTSSSLYPAWAEFLLWAQRTSPALTFAMVVHIPFAGVAALLFGGSLLYGRLRPRKSEGRAHVRWRDMLPPLWAYPLILLAVTHGVADSALHRWMAYYLGREGFGPKILAPGLVLSGYAIAYIAARVGLALLPERFGRRAFLVAPGVLGGAVMCFGLLSGSYAVTSVAYVVGAFLWSVEYPAAVASLADALPGRFGSVMAFQGVLTALGCAAGTYIVGRLTEALGDAAMWKIMLVPAAGFSLCSVFGLVWILWGRRRAEAAGQ